MSLTDQFTRVLACVSPVGLAVVAAASAHLRRPSTELRVLLPDGGRSSILQRNWTSWIRYPSVFHFRPEARKKTRILTRTASVMHHCSCCPKKKSYCQRSQWSAIFTVWYPEVRSEWELNCSSVCHLPVSHRRSGWTETLGGDLATSTGQMRLQLHYHVLHWKQSVEGPVHLLLCV